jgi:hypothetical protein
MTVRRNGATATAQRRIVQHNTQVTESNITHKSRRARGVSRRLTAKSAPPPRARGYWKGTDGRVHPRLMVGWLDQVTVVSVVHVYGVHVSTVLPLPCVYPQYYPYHVCIHSTTLTMCVSPVLPLPCVCPQYYPYHVCIPSTTLTMCVSPVLPLPCVYPQYYLYLKCASSGSGIVRIQVQKATRQQSVFVSIWVNCCTWRISSPDAA